MYRLFLKTHNKGLKYLCKSEQEEWKKYLGSGVYWKRYLKIYGKGIETKLLFETNDLEEFKKVCLAESKERNIVESEDYANLIMENGVDGGGGGDYWLGKGGEDHPLFGRKRPDLSERNVENNPMNNLETRAKLSEKNKGKHEIVTCPHCGKSGGSRAMKRHHFDNCKEKNNG